MKKADNFNPANWLVENKITFQSRLDEMEKFDATAYQEKSNFEPKQYGDKYNVQFEVTYVDGITSGNVMFKTFDVYAESEDEAIKKGEARLKEWSYTAFEGDPEFEMESYEFYGIENESEMDRDSDPLNEKKNSSQFPSWYDSFLEQLSDEFDVDPKDLPFEMVDPHLMGVVTHDFSQDGLDNFPDVVKAVLKRPEFKGKAIMAYDNKVEGGIQDKLAEKYPHLEDYLQDDEYYYIFIK